MSCSLCCSLRGFLSCCPGAHRPPSVWGLIIPVPLLLTLFPQVSFMAPFLPLFESLLAGASMEKPLPEGPLKCLLSPRPQALAVPYLAILLFVVLSIHLLVSSAALECKLLDCRLCLSCSVLSLFSVRLFCMNISSDRFLRKSAWK